MLRPIRNARHDLQPRAGEDTAGKFMGMRVNREHIAENHRHVVLVYGVIDVSAVRGQSEARTDAQRFDILVGILRCRDHDHAGTARRTRIAAEFTHESVIVGQADSLLQLSDRAKYDDVTKDIWFIRQFRGTQHGF